MNESDFISANQAQWKELERLLESSVRDPDQLHELFVKVSSDLSYARTFYPNRTVRLYLNGLTQQVLDLIQTRKSRFAWSDITVFYKHTLPEQLWRARFSFLVSFMIFATAIAIGVISTAADLDFTRVILGDAYVEMTNKNINDGDPMAVYKSMGQMDMFWGITLNNIRVAFLAFVMGLFGSIGTVIILISNGVMLGAFQYFFYKKGLFLTSFLTIWIHGTIEISAIIIAGAAGLILGDGLLNPRTYNRSLSLQVASKRAIRVLLSTVPLFVIAGFLESYVTRLTDLPTIVKASIITASLLFIIIHYIIYPYRYQSKHTISKEDYDIAPTDAQTMASQDTKYRTFAEVTEVALAQFRLSLGAVFSKGIFPVFLFIISGYWLWAKYQELMQSDYVHYGFTLLFSEEIGGWGLFILYWILCSFFISIISHSYHRPKQDSWMQFLKNYGVHFLILPLPYLLVFYCTTLWPFLIFVAVLPPQIFFSFLNYSIVDRDPPIHALKKSLQNSYSRYGQYLPPLAIVSFIYFLLILLVSTLSNVLYTDFLSWHDIFPGHLNNAVYIQSIFYIIVSSIALILYYYMYAYQHASLECKEDSRDLFDKIDTFGQKDAEI